MNYDEQKTYGYVMYAIRSKGIESVRKAVYGEDEKYSNEAVAICMWVNSRMAKKELQAKLDIMGN